MDVTTKKQTVLLAKPAYYNDPVLSHHGQMLAYISNAQLHHTQAYDRARYAARYLRQVCILHLKNNNRHCLKPLWDGYMSLLGWQDDDRALLIKQDYHLTQRLVALGLHSQQWHSISKQVLLLEPALNRSAQSLAFTTMQPEQAPQVMLSSVKPFKPRRISPAPAALALWGHTKVYSWRGTNHDLLQAYLTLPVNYKPGHALPLIIAVHGGPANHWWGSYIGSPHTLDTPICFGCLASAGFAVFRPNVHGSAGYGADFLLSNFKQIGKIDYQDIILALKQLVKQSVVDPKRVGVWGWSYGGFMAQWINENSKAVQAVVAGAAISDWVSLEGTSDYHSATYLFGVPFWKNAKPWIKASPVFHVATSHAPVLIQAGTHDLEVPLSQSMQLYYALMQAHRPVKMRIYAGQEHEFSDPNQLLAAMHDAQAWFVQHLISQRLHAHPAE